MTNPDGPGASVKLGRALAGLHHVQRDWLDDARQVCAGDPLFIAAFRRWEEQLTVLKLHLHRTESRLLHLVAVASHSDDKHTLPALADRRALGLAWRQRFETWLAGVHIDPAYRRIDSPFDHDQEAITADIATDLALVAEIAEATSETLATLDPDVDPDGLDELAFYRVIAPWRSQGLTALMDVLRWLSETLREQEDW